MAPLLVEHAHHVVVQGARVVEAVVQNEQCVLEGTVVRNGQALAIDELFQPALGHARIDEQFGDAVAVERVVGLGAAEDADHWEIVAQGDEQ